MLETKKQEKIVILHYSMGMVLVLDFDSKKYPDPDDFFKELYNKHDIYVSDSNSHFMVVSDIGDIDYKDLLV